MLENDLIVFLICQRESNRLIASYLALVGLLLFVCWFFRVLSSTNSSDSTSPTGSDSSASSDTPDGSGDDPWWKYVLKVITAVVVITSAVIFVVYNLPGGAEWINSFVDYIIRTFFSGRPCESVIRVPQLHSVLDVRSRAYLAPVGLIAYIYYWLDWFITSCGGSPVFTPPQFKQLLGVFEPLSPLELEIMIQFENAHESWQRVQPLLQSAREISPDKFQYIFAVSPSPELATLINEMFESGELLRLPRIARENALAAYGVDWNFNFNLLSQAQIENFDRILFKVISELTRSLDDCHSREDLMALCNAIISYLPDAYTMKVIMAWLHHMSLQPVVPFGPRVVVGFF